MALTLNEFIDGYVARGKLPPECRTEDGFKIGEWRCRALPCSCGDKLCDGWAVVSDEFIDSHMELYAPRNADV